MKGYGNIYLFSPDKKNIPHHWTMCVSLLYPPMHVKSWFRTDNRIYKCDGRVFPLSSIKVQEGVEVCLQSFLTWTLYALEWSAPLSPLSTEWYNVWTFRKRENLLPCQKSNLKPSVIQPVTWLLQWRRRCGSSEAEHGTGHCITRTNGRRSQKLQSQVHIWTQYL